MVYFFKFLEQSCLILTFKIISLNPLRTYWSEEYRHQILAKSLITMTNIQPKNRGQVKCASRMAKNTHICMAAINARVGLSCTPVRRSNNTDLSAISPPKNCNLSILRTSIFENSGEASIMLKTRPNCANIAPDLTICDLFVGVSRFLSTRMMGH